MTAAPSARPTMQQEEAAAGAAPVMLSAATARAVAAPEVAVKALVPPAGQSQALVQELGWGLVALERRLQARARTQCGTGPAQSG